MAAGRKIEGLAEVTGIGSTLNGMPWETSYAEFTINGETLCWISDKAQGLRENDVVNLRAFVRENSNRLYRVSASLTEVC